MEQRRPLPSWPGKIQEMVSYIHRNISDPNMTVERIEYDCGCTSHIYRTKFKHYVKTSVYQYILQRRISLAARLLLDPRLEVGEIAFSIGFENPNSFSRAFKRIKGSSPIEFRQN
jgi:AraC-like DNA-binding protein